MKNLENFAKNIIQMMLIFECFQQKNNFIMGITFKIIDDDIIDIEKKIRLYKFI